MPIFNRITINYDLLSRIKQIRSEGFIDEVKLAPSIIRSNYKTKLSFQSWKNYLKDKLK